MYTVCIDTHHSLKAVSAFHRKVRVTKDAYPLDTKGLVLRYGTDDCAIVFRGSKSLVNYLLGDAVLNGACKTSTIQKFYRYDLFICLFMICLRRKRILDKFRQDISFWIDLGLVANQLGLCSYFSFTGNCQP